MLDILKQRKAAGKTLAIRSIGRYDSGNQDPVELAEPKKKRRKSAKAARKSKSGWGY
jgi:hypothetical protein